MSATCWRSTANSGAGTPHTEEELYRGENLVADPGEAPSEELHETLVGPALEYVDRAIKGQAASDVGKRVLPFEFDHGPV